MNRIKYGVIGLALMIIGIAGSVGIGATVTQAEGRLICYDPMTANVRRADSCLTGGREFIFTSRANYERFRFGETNYGFSGTTHWSSPQFASAPVRTDSDRLRSCQSLHRQRAFSGGLWFGQGCHQYGVRAFEASR